MGEPKFTKGPWKYDENGGSLWSEDDFGCSSTLADAFDNMNVETLSVVDANDAPIVQIQGPSGPDVVDQEDEEYLQWPCTNEQAYANAHLIAAAPELYEALAALHQIAELTTFSDQFPLETEKASIALLKAQGEEYEA